jgi:hypothetical protein
MAIEVATDQGVLSVPGSYVTTKVQSTPGGLATTGILAVIGEADGGPRFSEETRLSENVFGPDQLSELVAKYGSGPLVDAFQVARAASNDAQIQGSFAGFYPIKVNTSVKSATTLPKFGGGTYAGVTAALAGKPGNMISQQAVLRQAEVLPSSGATVYAPPQQNTAVAFRVNGGAEVSTTVNTGVLPSAFVTAVDGLTGVAATGGTNRNIVSAGMVSGGDTVSITQDSGFSAHLDVSTAWAVIPTVGDILYIPTGSPFAAANEGTYVVIAATTTRIDVYKLLDAAGAGTVRTAPSTEAGLDIAAITDVAAFAPVVITIEAAAVSPGLGKSLEVANSGSNSISTNLFTFASATASPPAAASTWVSTSSAPKVLTATEYQVDLRYARATDGVSETISSDSQVILTLGYKGTTASAVITSAGVMTITVVGGAGSSPAAITLSDFPTVNDLVAYLSTLTGFSAAAATTTFGQISPTKLDPGTYSLATTQGAKTGRIKADGSRFRADVNAASSLVRIAPVAPAPELVGLPDVSALAFMTGGSRGGMSNADVTAALTAMEALRVNFVIPLASRDAAADIADGLTDASSTYDFASVHAATKSHCLLMSQFEANRPRQCFVGIQSTFTADRAQAGNLASERCAVLFQNPKDVNASGTLVEMAPHYFAVKAAAMQAAGFYRALIHKFVNVSGARQVAADWTDEKLSDVKTALKSGLLPVVKDENGGFKFASDQTSYTKDTNFVFNSIQAVYILDVLAQTIRKRMEIAFVGQSVADVSASTALAVLDGIMKDLFELKLIAASDDAPAGYKDPSVRLRGPDLLIKVTVKLATSIYFVRIPILAQPVQQSA